MTPSYIQEGRDKNDDIRGRADNRSGPVQWKGKKQSTLLGHVRLQTSSRLGFRKRRKRMERKRKKGGGWGHQARPKPWPSKKRFPPCRSRQPAEQELEQKADAKDERSEKGIMHGAGDDGGSS